MLRSDNLIEVDNDRAGTCSKGLVVGTLVTLLTHCVEMTALRLCRG